VRALVQRTTHVVHVVWALLCLIIRQHASSCIACCLHADISLVPQSAEPQSWPSFCLLNCVYHPSRIVSRSLCRRMHTLFNHLSSCLLRTFCPVVNRVQASVRRTISVVPQDAVLFNQSVAYNIRYGVPGAKGLVAQHTQHYGCNIKKGIPSAWTCVLATPFAVAVALL